MWRRGASRWVRTATGAVADTTGARITTPSLFWLLLITLAAVFAFVLACAVLPAGSAARPDADQSEPTSGVFASRAALATLTIPGLLAMQTRAGWTSTRGNTLRLTVRSTSARTFLLVPAAVAAEQAARRRPLRPAWSPLLATGFLTYRLAGRYRLQRADGPPGMSQGMPERLVTTGPYAVTRNPMYLGHLVFLAGIALLTRSPLAAAVAVAHVPWFSARVRRDEARLRERFGAPYDEYCARVPRWLPGLTADRALLPPAGRRGGATRPRR